MSLALLQQRMRQFLVHSFLYYQLGESLISDSQYDQLCRELQELIQAYPQAKLSHLPLVREALGQEASGYRLKKYPPEIISVALHLLYQAHEARLEFTEFLARQGFRWEFGAIPLATGSSLEQPALF